MEKQIFHILEILLMLIVVSESRVIAPKDGPSGDGKLPLGISEDKNLGLHPEIWAPEEGGDDFGLYDFDMGVIEPRGPPDYDYIKPGGGDRDKNKPEITKPEKIPSNEDRDENPGDEGDESNVPKNVDKDSDFDKKSGDEGFFEPFDGEKDFDKSFGGGEDSKRPAEKDEDKPNPKDVDESHHSEDDDKKIPEEDDDDDKKISEEDSDDKKVPEDDDDDKKEDAPVDDEEKNDEKDVPKEEEEDKDHIPVEDDDEESDEDEDDKNDENIGGGEEAGFFSGGSIFDTPIFNLNQVRKYFSQLERALGHVFRQTLDEALLLNGTYANTTEEEVDIDGKKYIVQKSIITGADNHSSIYIEALSSKTKMNDTEGLNDIDVKNVTHL